ncbi:protein trichome birefringence-like 23 [Iris pallida]|uniref:Protein trichome birefringence-like 23 n=1 Tax=Iris pallida TaxID=29817 RepID=A0AAX6HCA8_IRIPA|nr:protein trichome birefringence-like 23 [Iris pallida]
MLKEMAFSQWEQPCHALHKKSNHILCKLLLSVLLMGLTFKLLFSSHSPPSPFLTIPQLPNAAADETITDLESDTDIQLRENSIDMDNAIPPEPSDFEKQDSRKGDKAEKCDIFSGKWIPNPSGPAYTSTSCPFIEEPQNCLKNGRPDTGYLYWKWKPHGCTLPPFDAKKFLRAMRNKTWALIGDSILRNHAQSLVCLLSRIAWRCLLA